jgi:nitrogen-specific signal transduction histidine kinase
MSRDDSRRDAERAVDPSHRMLEERLRQAERMEVVGRLATGIAHDFNNLLTVIQSYAELALQGVTADTELHADLAELLTAAGRAGELSRQLLLFGRQDSGQPRLVDLNQVIDRASGMLRRLVGPDVTLLPVLDPDLWAVTADPTQLERVLVTLILNARDAMPASGRIGIDTANHAGLTPTAREPRLHPGDYVGVSITDGGIEPDGGQDAVGPLLTADPAGRGVDTGLLMVRDVVQQAGGYLHVERTPGRGTTTTILLPRSEHTAADDAGIGTAAALMPGGTETVLLVEDHAAVRLVARRVLLELGYTVLEASDGAEALDVWHAHASTIDLVLTDVAIPVVDGHALAERILAARADARILLMSGDDATAANPSGTVTPGLGPPLRKPFTLEGLARRVRAVLDATP